MATTVELLQKRQQVWVELKDLRAAKDENGKYTDPLATQKEIDLNQRFTDLTNAIQAQQIEDEQRKALDAEMLERDRNGKNTTTTAESSLTYDEAFWRWTVSPHGGTNRLKDEELRILETRGTSTQIGTTNSLGGFTIPESFSNELEVAMKWYGGILGAAGIMNDTIGGTLKYPSLDDTAVNGAVIAQGIGTTVSDLTFGNVLFGDYTIDSKIIKMSNELMNDNRVGLVQATLGELLPARLGRAVNALLTNGTGTNQPYGLTTTVTNSALTTAGATAITKAELIRAQHSIDKAYRTGPNVGWMMHDTILGYLRTLDVGNTDTVQIFTPSLVAGEPDRLLGMPIYINNDLEAANGTTRLPVTAKRHIYFGDFNKFKVRRIGGINLSRNESLYWAERAVGFMGWLRLDSNLVNASAIRYILQA